MNVKGGKKEVVKMNYCEIKEDRCGNKLENKESGKDKREMVGSDEVDTESV